MNLKKITQLKAKLKKELDSERYEHTLGVSYTAASLAMRYEANIYQAQLAGLLHDCGKCIPDHKKIEICDKDKVAITDFERENPFLIHAKLGAHLASKIYLIDDEEILNAITYHTTGRPEMSLLEKIVYIADYIEPLRNSALNLTKIRRAAFINIDRCLFMILEDSLNFLKSSDRHNIDPMTQQAYDYYFEKLKGK